MPDYKEMYLEMVRETGKAINILIDVQRKCEDMYIEAPEPQILPLDPASEVAPSDTDTPKT